MIKCFAYIKQQYNYVVVDLYLMSEQLQYLYWILVHGFMSQFYWHVNTAVVLCLLRRRGSPLVFTIHWLTKVTRSSGLSCGHLVTRCKGGNGGGGVVGWRSDGVREERSASAAARHPLGVAPIHHHERHHSFSPCPLLLSFSLSRLCPGSDVAMGTASCPSS